MKTIQKIYNSLSEMEQDIREKKIVDGWKCPVGVDNDGQDDWAGASWSGSLEMMRSGDLEGAKMIREAGEIAVPHTGAAPVARLDVRGCLPSVPNYLRGVPTNMLNIRREPRRQPVIDLYLNCFVAYWIKKEESVRAARLIAGVVKRVESTGVRVNIYAGSVSEGPRLVSAVFAKVKDSGAPLNLVNIAFPLTHPAFFRRVCMGWQERTYRYYSGHCLYMSFEEYEEKSGRKFDGVKIDLFTAIREDWNEHRVSEIFNQYLKGGR